MPRDRSAARQLRPELFSAGWNQSGPIVAFEEGEEEEAVPGFVLERKQGGVMNTDPRQ